MKLGTARRLVSIVLLTLVTALPAHSGQAETFVGSNVDSRVIIGFKVSVAGIQPFLPAGWTPAPFASGPMSGANLLLVLIDRAVNRDADNAPTDPPNSRHLALVGLGKQEAGDTVRLYVYRLYSTDAAPNPYGNSVAADVDRTNAARGPADQGRLKEESWRVAPESGGVLDIALNFRTGRLSWGPAELNPFSNTNPEFSRIYRYEQLVDLAMSVPAGKELAGAFHLSSTIPELADIFDGSEDLIAILDVPVYVRNIYLP